MDEQTYKNKMVKLKKILFVLFLISMILGLASFVVLGLYNIAGVFTLKTISGTKYENPFTYPGWQTLYYGVGNMIIQGYTENTTDIILILALYLPFFTLLIGEIMYITSYKKKKTNRKKAIIEFVTAVLLLVGGILLFNCDKFWISNAKSVTGSYTNYYQEYLSKALNGEEYFRKTFYPTLVLLISIITAVVKIANGSLLLYQKKLGKEHQLSLKK